MAAASNSVMKSGIVAVRSERASHDAIAVCSCGVGGDAHWEDCRFELHSESLAARDRCRREARPRKRVELDDLRQLRMTVHIFADARSRARRHRLEIVRIGEIGTDRLDDVFAPGSVGTVALVTRRKPHPERGVAVRPPMRIVQTIINRSQFAPESRGWNLTCPLINGMPQFMGIHHGSVAGRQVIAKPYPAWTASDLVYRSSTKVLSHFARRKSLSDSARCCRCKGVKFRCREGLVFSAHHSSTDHVFGGERSSFEVVGELSACIGWSSSRIVGLEWTKGF